MPVTDSAYFWKKKEVVSYLLSILVFLIHISSFSQHENNGTWISEVNQTVAYFFKEAITRFSVPMFFILSGATFFRNYSNASYFNKLKSRFFTLVIPYLIWNTVWMLFEIICSYTFLSTFFVGRQKFVLSFVNILKGIFFYKSNLPFWFIFNLFVFTVFSPLINCLVSRKAVSFAALGGLTLLRILGIHLPAGIFFDPNSLLFYFIGAIIGKHYFGKFTQKADRRTSFCSIAFLCLYFVVKTIYRPEMNSFFSPVFLLVIYSLCAFCLWNSMDLFIDHIDAKPLFSRSFAVYAMHVNVSAIISKLFALVLRKNEFFAIPNMIFTLAASLAFINFFCVVAERYCPRIYSILMGNRSC